MSTQDAARDDEVGMNAHDAFLLLHRPIEVAARCALGDGLSREEVYEVLVSVAEAILHPGDVAEDMSPISVPME